MHLFHSISFFIAHFDIYITASYLPCLINVMADQLFHGNMCQALKVTPTLAQHLSIIPFL